MRNSGSGFATRYKWVALGQPTRAGGYATNAVWGPDGQLESFVYGNGTVRTVERNERGLPQRIRDVRGGASVIDEQLVWDANGNLGSQFDWLNLAGGSRLLGYGGRDRLTSAWVSGYGTESFSWDAFDRLRWRTSWAGTETFSYGSTGLNPTHRLVSISGPGGTRNYTHDSRGNVITRPGFTHSFDAVNRLTETPGVGRFEYDGHGRRTVTWRADGTAKVDFYTVDGKVRYKTDNREGGGTDYIYLGDQLVAERKGPWRSARGTVYTHTDHLGSPVLRTTVAAQVYSRDRRVSFGAPLTLNPVEAEAGYTGHIEDPEQGLVYMQQRYYDPAIGRFLSVDPVGPLQNPGLAFGRYHYGNNNPYRYTDPDGRWAEDLILGVPSLALGTKSLYDNAIAGNVSGALVDAAGLVVDAAAIATPGIPGGAGLAIAAGRAADAATTASKGVDLADDVATGAITDGVRMSTDEALSAASRYLGDGYKQIDSGVFRSADGTTQVRMTDADITGRHSGGPHMNFESGKTVVSPTGRETFQRESNIHVYLPEEKPR